MTDRTARRTDLENADVAAVLDAVLDGDPVGWEEIVRRYRPLVLASVARFRLSAEDAADAVQTTWLRLLEHGHGIREPAKVGGWLATTARRECLALVRRNRGESLVETDWDELAATGPTPESVVVEADTRRIVRVAAAELSGRPALLVDALFAQPRVPYAELSTRFGIPVGSIGPTRSRALDRLRHRLADLVA
jgi:RNA polymerase sigma factor (sigma-70 family)